MPKSIEAHGVTIDEAIQNALNTLGLGRDSVEIEILHHPRGGFLGIGARRAKVRATQREQVMRDGEEFDMAPGDSGRGRRRRRSSRRRTGRGGEGRGRSGADSENRKPGPETRRPEARQSSTPASAAEASGGERATQEERSPRQRGEGRGRRGSRPRGGDGRRSEPRPARERGDDRTAGSETSDSRPAQSGSTPGEKAGRGDARDRQRAGGQRQDPEVARAKALEMTTELMTRMGYDAVVEAVATESNIDVSIQTPVDGELLIGRRGTTLDALEHLINRMTTGADTGTRIRVSLDVCNYRAQRKLALSELAQRLKQHVVATRGKAQVTPLSPADRVVFQEALAGDEVVTTRIVGSGFYRRVVVALRVQDGRAGPAAEFSDEGQLLFSGDVDESREDADTTPRERGGETREEAADGGTAERAEESAKGDDVQNGKEGD